MLDKDDGKIITFSTVKQSSDESKVNNLIKAIKGFGFQIIDSTEPLSFNVITGHSIERGINVVRAELKENGWFFKADLACIEYGSKNPLIDRNTAHKKINEAYKELQANYTGINVNGTEHNGVWQIRDLAQDENFTILFMLGLSRKDNSSPISIIQNLANLPKATFKVTEKTQ